MKLSVDFEGKLATPGTYVLFETAISKSHGNCTHTQKSECVGACYKYNLHVQVVLLRRAPVTSVLDFHPAILRSL